MFVEAGFVSSFAAVTSLPLSVLGDAFQRINVSYLVGLVLKCVSVFQPHVTACGCVLTDGLVAREFT